MAEAYGKLTGKPGICFVTRGPGATNASIGVHTAFQDSDADDPAHRPGRSIDARPRSVPGSRFPRDVRPACQMGRRNPRSPIAFRNMSRAPFTWRYRVDQARSCCLCPKMCCAADATRLPTKPYVKSEPSPSREDDREIRRYARPRSITASDSRRPGMGGAGHRRCAQLRGRFRSTCLHLLPRQRSL